MKRTKLAKRILCLWVAVFLVGGGRAETSSDDFPEKAQGVLTRAYPPEQPGAAAIVVRNGKTLFRGASGMANLELGVPLTPDMVFRLGSITKQFTAAAILLLAEEGKLSLEDPIEKFLPGYPTHGHQITVEHLLTHTSGIRSYTGIPGWMDKRIVNEMTPQELIDGFKHEPMDFAPGDQYRYNNSGYVLLGAIIEKLSERSYEEFVAERIFKPLGMQNSYYGSSSRIIPRRASGYGGLPGVPENARYLSMSQPYAAGSLLSTVEDLARWNEALFSGKLLSPQSVERMTTPFKLNDGSEIDYGYGLAISEIRGKRTIRHGGGIFGFSTDGLYVPSDGIYVAVLCNTTTAEIRPNIVAQKLAALALGDPYREWVAVDLPATVLESYAGVYRVDEETVRKVIVENGKLYTQRTGSGRLEATPASETTFFYKTSLSHFEFVRDEQGNVTAIMMYQDGAETPEKAVRTDEELRQEIDLDPALLGDFVGSYQVAPGFVLTITREGDALMAQATGQPKLQIYAESETQFFLKQVDAQLTFVRGEDGTVDEVILHQGGREIPAKRIR